MIEQGLFKRHFVGRDGFQWWVGQIPPEESWRENKSGSIDPNNSGQSGFGERYRVRIMGYHTANADDIPDEELPWAYVMYPVTAGGGGRGSSQNANLTQGTFVFGFFMDGEDAQLPVIMGVLGNNDYNAVMKNVTPTRFIPFDGYPMNDEVMGQKRSTTQVRSAGGGTTATQTNAQGQPTNDQYTSSAQGNTSVKPKADDVDGDEPPQPLSQTSECEKSPMGDVQRIMANVMNEIHKFNQLLYDARGAIAAGVADVQRYIDNAIQKVTGKIAGALKWVFTEMEKFILKKILGTAKLSFSLVMPDLRETLNIATSSASDAIVCIIRNLINELPGMVGGFISDIVGKVEDAVPNLGSPTKLVNVPRCFVEDFMATTFGNISGLITNAINDAMGVVDSITGGATQIIGDVMGFVDDLISFLTCGGMAETECTKVNEWSIKGGPGSKGGKSNISSMIGKVKNISSTVSNVGSNVSSSLTSLKDIDFTGVLANSQCDLGPRTCGPPTVEYIGLGQGAQIDLVVSSGGEILGGVVISPGIGFVPGKSYIKVYDDCGTGKGAVIKPVFGPVQPIPLPGIDPNATPSLGGGTNINPVTGLPMVSPALDDNGFPIGTPGQVTLPDGTVIAAGSNGEVRSEPVELWVDPKTGEYTTDPSGGKIVGVNPQTGEAQYIPVSTTGRPGDGNENEGNPIRTQSGLPGEPVEACQNIEFKIAKSSTENTAPIKVTFELVGDAPEFEGITTFSVDINQAGDTVTACLYPNRDYLVTATTFRTPETNRFDAALEAGWTPEDPGNILVRITDGPQVANAGGEEAIFGDYPNQTDRPALQQGNGIWCDYKDTLSGRPGRAIPPDLNLGSAGPRDFQIYPNKGVFKEVNENSDNVVLFTFEGDVLPVLPIPDDVPTQGIVDVIVVNSGYGYLPAPNGALGGDGATWAPPGYTVITGHPPDGTTDYYPPVPPGQTVGIPTDGMVKTPCNAPSADIIEPNGNMIEVLPCTPTMAPNGGTITTPVPYEEGDRGDYPSTDSYPVILYLCELIVDESGMDYSPNDRIVIEPDMGATAVPKFDNFGRLLSIKVTDGGEGFTERPNVYIMTETGFGANIIPKFCIDRVGVDDLNRNPSLQDKVVTVINCVGKV